MGLVSSEHRHPEFKTEGVTLLFLSTEMTVTQEVRTHLSTKWLPVKPIGLSISCSAVNSYMLMLTPLENLILFLVIHHYTFLQNLIYCNKSLHFLELFNPHISIWI